MHSSNYSYLIKKRQFKNNKIYIYNFLFFHSLEFILEYKSFIYYMAVINYIVKNYVEI